MTHPSDSIEDWLREYSRVGPTLRDSIAGLSREQLTARPGPGDWSIHEVVVHVVDSDLVAYDRMKRIVAMERPTLIPYDETAFAQTLAYHDQGLDDAILMFETGRRQMAGILGRLPAEAFTRVGIHTDDGELTLLDFVRRYVDHVEHHVRFIDAKRERMGAPR